MMKINYSQNWEEYAEIDTKWSILTHPDKKYDKWKDNDFFITGEKEAEKILKMLEDLKIIISYNKALDFGCGIGRVTRALGKKFNKVYGVDISKKMINEAKKVNSNYRNIFFLNNTENNLKKFQDNHFDFVYSHITLQHIPKVEWIKNYIKEFYRITKPGGVICFQLPSISYYSLSKKNLLKLRGYSFYFITDILKISKYFCYKKLKLKPFMEMNYLESQKIKEIFFRNAQQFFVFDDRSFNTIYIIKK